MKKSMQAARIEFYMKNFRREGAAHFFNASQQMLSMSEFNLSDYIFIRASVARSIALKMF